MGLAATGLAAVFVGPRQPFELREYPVPDPPPDGMLVRITQTNLCGSDLHFWCGALGPMTAGFPPSILRHEATGRVARLGREVRTDSLGAPLAEGDRVSWVSYRPCTRCRPCLRRHPNACLKALISVVRPCAEPPHFLGTFADYYRLLGGQQVFKVPSDLDDALVAGANCALAQVVFGFERAPVGLGDLVVIQGAGGLGLYATARRARHGSRADHRHRRHRGAARAGPRARCRRHGRRDRDRRAAGPDGARPGTNRRVRCRRGGRGRRLPAGDPRGRPYARSRWPLLPHGEYGGTNG